MAETIRVAQDFSPELGGRYEEDFYFSGEEFFNKILAPKLKEDIKDIVLDFDGIDDVPNSFADEVFMRVLYDFGVEALEPIQIVAPSSTRVQREVREAKDRALRVQSIRAKAYDQGYEDGHVAGYDNGYQAAMDDSMFDG